MLDVKIDRADPTLLYDQVAAQIRRAIADGEAKPGERLPPARDLAAVLGVSIYTVRRALSLLRDEGLLEPSRRPGIRVSGTPQRGDLNMPGGSRLEAIPQIRAEAPETQIVVLTTQEEPAFARQALGGGALGYVLKEAADGELVEAVRRAAAGESYLNPRLGARVASERPPGPPDDLSQREVDVLRLVALGHTNVEIAEQLSRSVRTVETQRIRIRRKLRLSSRSELVRYALKRGLGDPDV